MHGETRVVCAVCDRAENVKTGLTEVLNINYPIHCEVT